MFNSIGNEEEKFDLRANNDMELKFDHEMIDQDELPQPLNAHKEHL